MFIYQRVHGNYYYSVCQTTPESLPPALTRYPDSSQVSRTAVLEAGSFQLV